MGKKETLKRNESMFNDYSMNIKKFLNEYCGISYESLQNVKMSHEDIKSLFSDLERISFEDLDITQLYSGDVIIVVDSYGNIAPYVRPKFEDVKNDGSEYDVDVDTDDVRRKVVIEEPRNQYDLICACRILRRTNNYSKYNKFVARLKSSEANAREYKQRKKVLRMGDKYDKY